MALRCALRCVGKIESQDKYTLLELEHWKDLDMYVWKYVNESSTNVWPKYPLVPWTGRHKVTVEDLKCFPRSRQVKILAMKIALRRE